MLSIIVQKSKRTFYLPLSKDAIAMCGTRQKPEDYVFEDLGIMTKLSDRIRRWVKKAGINRKITFHCFRHTFAVQQLIGGTDIMVLRDLMCHTDVKTTQTYAKIVPRSKVKA